MPIVSIYHSEKLKDKINSRNPEIVKIIKEEFDVPEDSVMILYLAANPVYYGDNLNKDEDVYVEVKCKNKTDRTEEQFNRVLSRLQTFFYASGCANARIMLFRYPPQDITLLK